MKSILLAVLLAAAPALAQGYDRSGWDQGSWSQDGSGSDGYGYGDDRYGSQPADNSWQSYPDDADYTAGSGPTFDDFRSDSELTWNGEWIDTPEYGTVWRPTHVASDWQPYTYGRWVWTRAGWAWASDESFGWAVYHYGRWGWSPAVGWMWVPGSIWAPAWVSWRWSDGYAAWCPMGVRDSYVEQPALWVVVPTRTFLEPVVHHVVPRPQRRVIPLPARAPGGQQSGPPVASVERAIGRAVRPLAIGDARTPSAARTGFGAVMFYRPRTAPVAVPARNGQPMAIPQGPRGVPQGPATARPRPTWYGAPQPSVQARPQSSPPPTGFGNVIQQRPVAVPPPAATPHAASGTSPQPAPQATAPVARSNGEQPQVKER
ncbi:MAG: hypothetical protein E6J82_15480 [Deltaproteobacteria bacterium]|nr:MAG: hypothetical protein E6J82_15480 [Deltaproteobacteria bacterium]TMB41175.1 MAG: hypothetical protein E6J58_03585 [Deltaproteobacteria bacterium]